MQIFGSALILLGRWLQLVCMITVLSACSGGGDGGGRSLSLSAEARSASEIYLSWSKPSGGVDVSPFVVARNDANSTQRIGSATQRNFLVAGLPPGMRYCFVIRNPITGNTMSNTACTSTMDDRTAPQQPVGLAAVARSPVVIVVNWQSSYDEDRIEGYRIFRDDIPLTVVDDSTVRDDGLRPDTRYCYRVSAFDPSGNESVRSEQICATTIADTEAPSVPEDVTVESSTISGVPTMSISWSPSSDDAAIEAYTILRDGITYADTEESGFSDNDLRPNNSYCYSVIARDVVGTESTVSDEACAIASWRKQFLDEVEVGAAIVLIDSNSLPRVSFKQRYYDNGRREHRSTLKVATINGELDGETLDDSPAESYVWGEYSLDMVLAADGSSHMVHQRTSVRQERELTYVVRSGSQTEQSVIASPLDPLYGASIDADTAGIFHACFEYDNTLFYGNTRSGSWALTDMDELVTGTNGRNCSIAIDARDVVHLVYLDLFTNDLRYVVQDSAGWSGELIDRQSGTSTNTAYHTAIETDSSGAVHVAYAHDYSENDMEYATNASGSWITEKVDDSGTVGYAGAIAVDSTDRVLIVYEELPADRLRRVHLATRENGRWEVSLLSSSRGSLLSMAVDSMDFLHIVFAAEDGRFAYLTNRI